jgi:hypothetical protein
MADSYQAIYEHIDRHFDEYLEELRAYLRHPGFAHSGEGIREAATTFRDYLRSIGTEDAQLVETTGTPSSLDTCDPPCQTPRASSSTRTMT